MSRIRLSPRHRLILTCASLGLLCVACCWFFWLHGNRFPFQSYRLKVEKMEDWKAFGGTWAMTNGVVRNNSDERGAKLLAGSTDWTDYSLTTELKFDGEHGDMGVIIRSDREEEGVDAYSGYYVGLRTTDGTLVMGRSDYGWMEALPVQMPGGVHADTWYRLKVTAVGCDIVASSQNLTTMQMARAELEEEPCARTGRIGLRSLATGGMWRNIGVTRAGRGDTLEIHQQVGVVGHPEFPGREADYNRIFHFSLEYHDTPQPAPSADQGASRSLHIGDVQSFPRNQSTPVLLRGVVTHTSPGLYIQDSGGGILVKDAQIPPLNVGDAVEVAGQAEPGLYSAVVSGGKVRLLWSGSPIPPIAITPTQGASGAYDSRFVEIEGRLSSTEQGPLGERVLEFTEGGQAFRAVYANPPAGSLSQLKIDSLLRIRGVCVLDRKVTRELTPFMILLRSTDDIQILAGPRWWTPWHVSMLFACVIVLSLLLQQVYFRIHQWQANSIAKERERFAHEIHDTMAQSFAGVGYQIQGIRSGVLREGHQDFQQIAEQLTVAYQLVRRCHEEASRTIAMLGVSSPEVQNNLLEALAETAHRIAGNQINIATKLEGNPFQLNLRVANALLHIGVEAIANAVSHSDLSALNIVLRFEGTSVELTVEDNGKGFDYQPATAGFGILGMQKRARDIAAELCIVSVPGQGTKVYVRPKSQATNLRSRVLLMAGEKFRMALGLLRPR